MANPDSTIKLAEIIGIVLSIAAIALAWVTLIVPIKQYLSQKELEEKDKRFKNYHQLIDDLLGSNNKGTMVQRQMAIIFEFRNYPEYYEVTDRILNALMVSWGESASLDVVREIEITLDRIKK